MAARIEGAYESARRAFASPTLALLHKQRAPLVVTLLGALFTADRAAVPVADAHTEVGEALAGLRSAGFDDLPDASARDLCRQWVAESWLVRQVADDGTEEYRLTAHAVEALEVAWRAGGPRTRVTRSRLRTLLDAVEHLAQEVDPDVSARRDRIEAEVARLTAELEHLDAGGAAPTVAEDQYVEEAENVLFLVRELPADFARVAESIKGLQREVVAGLRQDERPTGEVLAAYLERAEHLLEATAEGRAFAGAMRLLADAERLDALAAELDLLLRHPYADALDPVQRAELRGITRRIETGLDAVLTQQRRTSHIITTQVRHHDPLRDRQVDDLLREVVSALAAWVPSSRRGQDVTALRRLPRIDAGRLRETTWVPARSAPPADIDVWDDDAGADASLAGARAWGGPHYARLLAHATEHAAATHGGPGGAPADELDVAAVFESAPGDLRRPVDLLGYLELALGGPGTDAPGLPAESTHLGRLAGVEPEDAVDATELSVVTATRPDGTTRRFAFGRTTLRLTPPEGDR
ncbi:DUF3375 domain-containing protein [Luteimicrobium subarcticum]|uniref:Uncharacterized protein DUF3375 n=1 Tax=Luteimicrobium subarcticum TaxID=620910 RepID=A0A2M8WR55_9MICO|nr:DUF3375 domain-containing protein [Luteimicrobium subarcticum]PJI93336.1 uncharacterized protein DUF3375 [Luteimicrobium subarcticum]